MRTAGVEARVAAKTVPELVRNDRICSALRRFPAQRNGANAFRLEKRGESTSGQMELIRTRLLCEQRAKTEGMDGDNQGGVMKSARQLLEEFTAGSFHDTAKAAGMFSANGAFEMPYLASLGSAWRYQGRSEIQEFFGFVRGLYPEMDFENVHIVCEAPHVVVAEYEFTAKSSRTGRTIHQLFVGRLEEENGQIKLLRESINLVELALAIYPEGLAGHTSKRETGTSS
jgi:uncharacterized protein